MHTIEFKTRYKNDYMTYYIPKHFIPEKGLENKYEETKKKLLLIIDQFYPDANDMNGVLLV